ncbi:MAG: diaminopimelate decarboxylase [Clostridia bacterium]|nr:diaminopimelate decarboxylase [Clostridia bacterium]
MVERETLKANSLGHLEIGGCDCVDLAKQYGTPLYVLDEDYIRAVCRGYTEVLDTYGDALICYASKAFSTKAIYEICASENLGADVVSAGELLTALSSSLSANNIIFHGNNKSPFELELAVKNGVHAVVIDSEYEVELLNEIAREFGVVQNVLVRVNPGIDAHTHKFIQTTRVDSKFGFSIGDGTALEIIKKITTKSNLHFAGPHCHIGSQIFSLEPFRLAVEKMTDFIVALNQNGVEVEELNLGGGYGVRYTDADAPLKPVEYVSAIIEKLKECIEVKKIKKPRLILEPGRSIVAEAGITLYSVGAIKEIKGIKKYLSVDGGMFEAPRYALYGAEYDCVLANRVSEMPTETVTIAGKCCESGDMVACDVKLPVAKSGDILAVLSTGAYHYSMASNYNRNLVPPVVLACKGKSDYIVRPQTYEDIVARDAVPTWLKK